MPRKDTEAAMPERENDETAHVEERLEMVRGFIEWWHGPSLPEQGIAAIELASIRLPRPLRWWYESVGRSAERHCGPTKRDIAP